MILETLRWKDGRLSILDQTRLPGRVDFIALDTREDVWEAIRALKVRGAPAIGVCAAFGVLVCVRDRQGSPSELTAAVDEAVEYLGTSRPTAVNLFWALERMRQAVKNNGTHSAAELYARLEREAQAILDENLALCEAIGKHGAPLIREGDGILTHCNAGPLATTASGTALAPMFQARAEGRHFRVFADETRPLLQGARLTAWELMQAGIEVVLICDNPAGEVMRAGKVAAVIVGADRIAANGDTANKIGTYSVAVLARAHNIPFYVAAPYSTFDFSLPSGEEIPIELRDPSEVTHGFGRATAPEGVQVYSPAFDVTPAELITAFITDRGLLYPPFDKNIGHLREQATV